MVIEDPTVKVEVDEHAVKVQLDKDAEIIVMVLYFTDSVDNL